MQQQELRRVGFPREQALGDCARVHPADSEHRKYRSGARPESRGAAETSASARGSVPGSLRFLSGVQGHRQGVAPSLDGPHGYGTAILLPSK